MWENWKTQPCEKWLNNEANEKVLNMKTKKIETYHFGARDINFFWTFREAAYIKPKHDVNTTSATWILKIN